MVTFYRSPIWYPFFYSASFGNKPLNLQKFTTLGKLESFPSVLLLFGQRTVENNPSISSVSRAQDNSLDRNTWEVRER